MGGLQQFITGKSSFLGSLGVEVIITDALNDEVILATVDKRYGGEELSGDQLNSLEDVNTAIKLYGQMVKYRACQFQKRSKCIAPPEQNV